MPGIEETKDVVKFVIRVGEAGAKSLEDGKFTLGDVTQFITALGSLPAAIAGIGEVPAELKDMDAAEREELIAFINEEFDIPQDAIESVVEKALAVGIDIFELVREIAALGKGGE